MHKNDSELLLPDLANGSSPQGTDFKIDFKFGNNIVKSLTDDIWKSIIA
jgi:hypothetical protein